MYVAFNVSFERYFLFLSEETKKKLQEEIDEFSDSYYLDLNFEDIKLVNCISVCVYPSCILFSFCVPWMFYSKVCWLHYNVDTSMMCHGFFLLVIFSKDLLRLFLGIFSYLSFIILQLLGNINRSEDVSTVNHYKKKYCPKDKWSVFNGCSIYFCNTMPSL